jgi:hypothetical protein
MPDLLLRSIDDTLAERIKRYTRERGLPLNSCMLELIAIGLDQYESKPWIDKSAMANQRIDESPAAGTMPAYGQEVMRETRILGGTWNNDEASAFREAMQAIQGIPSSRGVNDK